MSNRYTIKDLRTKAARLNTMIHGDPPDTEQSRPAPDGLYGRTARELFDLMDAFEQGYRFDRR